MLSQVQDLNAPEQWEPKRCIRCGITFRRKTGSREQWDRRRYCSRKCQLIYLSEQTWRPIGRIKGTHTKIYECSICHERIKGSKRDLKRHKHDQHSQ